MPGQHRRTQRSDPFDEGGGGLLRQPKAVWATAGAAVVAFMGIGLVDPILPSIAQGLQATPSQVSLLFTSYFLITAVAMLVTGFVSSRIGGRRTLFAGLALVVVFAALAGLSGSVGQLVGFRAGWGLGNALAPRIEGWADIHLPFVVAALTALAAAGVVWARRPALRLRAEELQAEHHREDAAASAPPRELARG